MKNSLPFTEENLEILSNEHGTDYYNLIGKVSSDELLKLIRN